MDRTGKNILSKVSQVLEDKYYIFFLHADPIKYLVSCGLTRVTDRNQENGQEPLDFKLKKIVEDRQTLYLDPKCLRREESCGEETRETGDN